MMRGEDSDEVEIDLSGSEASNEEDFEERGGTIWRAPEALEDEDTIDTTNLVEISDTRPLINARDPRGINQCLQVLLPPSVISRFYIIEFTLKGTYCTTR